MLQTPTALNRPGEDNRQIKFEKAFLTPNEQVLSLEDGSLHLQLYDLDFYWFSDMLRKTPQDLDLATSLREHALQYDGRGTELKHGRDRIARCSLEYIQVSNIEIYIFHCSLIKFKPWFLPGVWHTVSEARPPPRHQQVHYLQRMQRRFRHCRLGLAE
jgi:hypothetical protein